MELILTELVLLSENEGGRTKPPAAPYEAKYRPHIVIEDRHNRNAKIEVIEGRHTMVDHYLGVVFWKGPDPLLVGQPLSVTMLLVYALDLYNEVKEGASFTIREGAKIIGHGVVKKRWSEEGLN